LLTRADLDDGYQLARPKPKITAVIEAASTQMAAVSALTDVASARIKRSRFLHSFSGNAMNVSGRTATSNIFNADMKASAER